MATIPNKLFVNLYPPGVGGNVGTAFPTRFQADECSTSHRLARLEMGTNIAGTSMVALNAEILLLTDRYALTHGISRETAANELLRAALGAAA